MGVGVEQHFALGMGTVHTVHTEHCTPYKVHRHCTGMGGYCTQLVHKAACAQKHPAHSKMHTTFAQCTPSILSNAHLACCTHVAHCLGVLSRVCVQSKRGTETFCTQRNARHLHNAHRAHVALHTLKVARTLHTACVLCSACVQSKLVTKTHCAQRIARHLHNAHRAHVALHTLLVARTLHTDWNTLRSWCTK